MAQVHTTDRSTMCQTFGGTGKGCAVSAPPNDF